MQKADVCQPYSSRCLTNFISEKLVSKMAYLKKIKLQNFSVFKNFEYKFHKRLNFFVGMNGSGKSSIIYGAMLALGYKVDDIRKRLCKKQDSVLTTFIHKGSAIANVELTVFIGPSDKLSVLVEITSTGEIFYHYQRNEERSVQSDRIGIRNLLRGHFPDSFRMAFVTEDREQKMRQHFRRQFYPAAPPQGWKKTAYLEYIFRQWQENCSGSFVLDAPDLFASSEEEIAAKFKLLSGLYPNKQFFVVMFELCLEVNESEHKIIQNPAGRKLKRPIM